MLRKNSEAAWPSAVTAEDLCQVSAMPCLDFDHKQLEEDEFHPSTYPVPLRTPLDCFAALSSVKPSPMLQLSLPSPGLGSPCTCSLNHLTCPFGLNSLANRLIVANGTKGSAPHLCQLAIDFFIGTSWRHSSLTQRRDWAQWNFVMSLQSLSVCEKRDLVLAGNQFFGDGLLSRYCLADLVRPVGKTRQKDSCIAYS